MNPLLTAASIWCLTFSLYPAFQAGENTGSNDLSEKLRQIDIALRAVWGQEFDSNHRKYMRGPSSTVILIPRQEMMRIAATPLDGRLRDGATTHGLTITGDTNYLRIVVVYDDLAPLFVARTINHEIGHLQLMGKGLSRNEEEARVQKVVDTRFFEKYFGIEWLQTTVAELQKKVMPVQSNGRLYQGYTQEAVEFLYQQFGRSGATIEKNPLHDGIVASLVFILTNSEEDLSAALDTNNERNLSQSAR